MWHFKSSRSQTMVTIVLADWCQLGTEPLLSSRTIWQTGQVWDRKLTHWLLGDLKGIFGWLIIKVILVIDGWGIIVKLPSDESQWILQMVSRHFLVQVMAWCRQAASHYLSQCWLNHHMASPGHNRVNPFCDEWFWWNMIIYSLLYHSSKLG